MSEFWQFLEGLLPYGPVLTMACLTCGIILVATKQQSNQLTWLFSAFSITLIVWSLMRVGMRLSPNEAEFIVWSKFYYAATVIVSAQMLQAIMAIQEPGRAGPHRFVITNWVMAIALAVGIMVSQQGISGWVRRPWGFEPELGLIGKVVWPWQCLMVLGILQHFWQRWSASKPASSERTRLKALIPMLLFVILGSMNFFHDLTGLLLPLSFVFITLFGASMVYASFRYGLLDTKLSSAIGELSNQFKQGLMVVDSQLIVRYANASAAEILERPMKHMRSVKVAELMGRHFEGQWSYIQKRLGDEPGHFDWRYPSPSGVDKNLSVTMQVERVNNDRDLVYILSFENHSATYSESDSVSDMNRLDPLTRLILRDTFEELLVPAIKGAREDRRFELLLIALDDYKRLKREYGQLAVDQCATVLVKKIQAQREVSDVVARLAEDEFVLLLPVHDHSPRAVPLLSELRASLAAPIEMADARVQLGISSARSLVDSDQNNASFCLQRLMRCLRLAQAAGKDQHFNADSTELLAGSSELEQELNTAIQQRQFVVHYQPLLDVRKRRIVALEALVRWQHPQRGLLFPGEFIEFAEDIGLGAAIDREVMRQGLQDVAEIKRQFPYDEFKINFNIGAEPLESPDFVEEVIKLVQSSGLRAREIQLEVLERSTLSKGGALSLQKLSKAGFCLAVDDFGIGYSSLVRLQDLPVKLLKIDRSFVDFIDQESGAAVVRSIINIARKLDLGVVVEGVETESQLDWFYRHHCFEIQGWLFAKAVDKEQVMRWLALSEFPSEYWPTTEQQAQPPHPNVAPRVLQ